MNMEIFILQEDWGGGGGSQGHGCRFYNPPHRPNPFPPLYIEQAPTNAPLDTLSMVTNTN